MVITSGPVSPTATMSTSPSVPDAVCWPLPVPSQLIVIAVSGLRPLATSSWAVTTTSSAATVRTSDPGAWASDS